VYPDSLPPLGHVHEVGLLAVQLLVWGVITEDAGGRTVFEPNSMSQHLSPQVLQQFGLMLHGTRAFHKAAVKGFCDAVVLRCVSRRKVSLSPLLLKEISELGTFEFPTVIGSKSFNANVLLCVHPHSIGLVCLKCLVLGVQVLQLSPACGVVSEYNIIFSPTKTLNWSWPPHVSMDFIPKHLSQWCLPLLANGLLS